MSTKIAPQLKSFMKQLSLEGGPVISMGDWDKFSTVRDITSIIVRTDYFRDLAREIDRYLNHNIAYGGKDISDRYGTPYIFLIADLISSSNFFWNKYNSDRDDKYIQNVDQNLYEIKADYTPRRAFKLAAEKTFDAMKRVRSASPSTLARKYGRGPTEDTGTSFIKNLVKTSDRNAPPPGVVWRWAGNYIKNERQSYEKKKEEIIELEEWLEDAQKTPEYWFADEILEDIWPSIVQAFDTEENYNDTIVEILEFNTLGGRDLEEDFN